MEAGTGDYSGIFLDSVGYCFGSGEDGEMTLTEIEQVQRAFEKCAKIVDETESESFQRLCPKCKLLAGEHLRAVLNKIRAASPKKPK